MEPMKAAVFTEIDGIKIVTAIVDPVPDPEATLEMARIEVAARGYRSRFDDLIRRGKDLDPNDREASKELKRDVTQYAFDQAIAIRDHARSNPVYFSYVPNEELLQHDRAYELKKKLRSLKKNERLALSGAIIEDNRGRSYYRKREDRWVETEIKSLSETKPEGCIWREGLTDAQHREIDEQREIDRIAKLTLTERRIQAAMEIEMAAKNCASMRSTLEIKGDNDALKKARDQFERLKAEIIERYHLEDESGASNERRQHEDPEREADSTDRCRDTRESPKGGE